MFENCSDRRMMSSQPWSDSQVHGFFHLLFSREMFPNHREKRVPARGLSVSSTQTMPTEHPHGSCSGERLLCQGVRRHGLVSPVSPDGQLSQASSLNTASYKGANQEVNQEVSLRQGSLDNL